jgi:hypothetical protein
MVDMDNVRRSIEVVKDELLEAIRERIVEAGEGAVLQLYPLSVTEISAHARGLRNSLELRNLYLNERNHICGDCGCINDGVDCGVLFGKSLEGLFLEDLFRVLQGVEKSCRKGNAVQDERLLRMDSGRFRRELWKNRLQRKGA